MTERPLPGVRAELVRKGIALPRRRVRAAIEALGFKPDEVRALVLERNTVTVVLRNDKKHLYPIITLEEPT